MKNKQLLIDVKNVLNAMPEDWLTKTTHRLDIYNESLAKVEFTEALEALFTAGSISKEGLSQLPTAYDYIRLGHPLSCLLEWLVAKENNLQAQNVISFSSIAMPIYAVLRHNLLKNKKTQIVYKNELPSCFDVEGLRTVYGYKFELVKVESFDSLPFFDGSTVVLNTGEKVLSADFLVNIIEGLGSIILVGSHVDKSYISEIQHVRRRESIAMTPANCLIALNAIISEGHSEPITSQKNKTLVLESIKKITKADTQAVLGSSGLSIQYAILMGLMDDAIQKFPGKKIKIIVPPNCYGGTNDQARRVTACVENAEVVDLHVDDGNDMVSSLEKILSKVAEQNAVPYIIAEIPTNPRVEVPDLVKLAAVLSKSRKAKEGDTAINPVFILDQTFCPNVDFLSDSAVLSSVQTISYVSGSKFPSGGQCTAGYCVANKKAERLIEKIDKHIKICDNEATSLQIDILSEQLPSMLQRIDEAYKNTRSFVNYIIEILPNSKINFVSEELASQGFTPSVFSLDLPTEGNTAQEKEDYKRELNHKLIKLMINNIPNESQHCVSYGQLKGCYWTVPATSTQGTTKEGDKDYIVRVAVSPDLDLEKHKKVFLEFVSSI